MATPDHDRALADADLVVRIEVGTLTLPASRWAALSPGEVLTTDTPIGAEAVLRSGGVVLARGELCDVDGHLGVRITETTS